MSPIQLFAVLLLGTDTANSRCAVCCRRLFVRVSLHLCDIMILVAFYLMLVLQVSLGAMLILDYLLLTIRVLTVFQRDALGSIMVVSFTLLSWRYGCFVSIAGRYFLVNTDLWHL